MIEDIIKKLVKGSNLTALETEKVFKQIMSGKLDSDSIAVFLMALSVKGETATEITAAAKIMRKYASSIKVAKGSEPILDTCGTGGSGIDTFNISTASAFVVAGCGVKVAKHGNRSVSSACGSADVLEELGVNISLSPKQVEKCIKAIGIGFMFAPLFHPAMKHAMPARRALGVRTIFNILGPLSNPANATCQVLGVYDKALTTLMAKVLSNLGVKRAFVVHGLEGLDEISILGETQVSELRNKKIRTYKISSSKLGFNRASLKDIKGKNKKENAKIILSVLKGAKGSKRDAVVLNAGFALVAAGRAKNIKDAIKLAEHSIDSGAAIAKLKQLKVFTKK